MAVKKRNRRWSMASDRDFVEMAKTTDLNAIARKTGRQPESILETAKRLGVSIKGRKAKGK
jgi:predicted RNA-binding protein with PUA-like domain